MITSPSETSNDHISFLHDSELTSDRFFEFMQKVDRDFSPPLSSRVDLRTYTEKLCRDAVTVLVLDEDDQEVLGALSFYCNPESYSKASLSFIAVLPSSRGKGYARVMMKHCLEYVQLSGMNSIETRTWQGNTPMISLLEEFGYRFAREEVDWTGRPSIHYCLAFDRG